MPSRPGPSYQSVPSTPPSTFLSLTLMQATRLRQAKQLPTMTRRWTRRTRLPPTVGPTLSLLLPTAPTTAQSHCPVPRSATRFAPPSTYLHTSFDLEGGIGN